jgi:hypothetical protein
MPLADIDICNMALGHLGRTAGGIQSFTENSNEARQCKLWYDPCRQQVLEAQDWSFARKRVSLALHSDAPPVEWAFRYQAPADMLAMRRIWNPFSEITGSYGVWPNAYIFGANLGDAVPYEIESSLDGETSTILTNQESAIAFYTFDCSLVQRFSSMFVSALAHYLAAKMAFGMTGKQSVEDKELKAFSSAMAGASASDANQGVTGPQRDATTIRARM